MQYIFRKRHSKNIKKRLLCFYSCHVFNVFNVFQTSVIIKNVSTNVTQNSILMIFYIVCYVT